MTICIFGLQMQCCTLVVKQPTSIVLISALWPMNNLILLVPSLHFFCILGQYIYSDLSFSAHTRLAIDEPCLSASMIFANFTNTTKDPPLCISITLCMKYNYPLNCYLNIHFIFNPFFDAQKNVSFQQFQSTLCVQSICP